MSALPLRRAGLVVAGLVLGLFVLALVVWLYLRAAQVGQLETALRDRLALPKEALELEEISDEGRLRIALRDVVLLEEDGDTIARVPRLSFWFDPQSLPGEGPIELTDVTLVEPYLRLVQTPEGEWNIFQALRIGVAGEELATNGDHEEGVGRVVALRGVEINDGRVIVAVPAAPVDTATFAARLQLPRELLGGTPYQVYRFRDVDARLPVVRVGGEEAWSARVAALNARLVEPDLRIENVQLQIAAAGEDAVRFDLESLRIGESRLAGEGRIRFAEERTIYDVRLQAAPLAFADLQALLPSLPEQGEARFTLVTEPVDGRTALAFQDLRIAALDARISGRLTALVGGEAPVAFRDTRLELESFDLVTLERLGLVEEVPFRGQIAGTISTPAELTAELEGGLHLDLTARLVPAGRPALEPSVISAVGGLALGGAGEPYRLRDLQLQLQPLYLETLAPLVGPEQRERLRGALRGMVTVSGTPRELRIGDGTLSYVVGAAQPTRVTGLSGTLSLEPGLRYELEARAQPLALATLTELFPALPFRTATLAGPIRVSGGAEQVAFNADLEGAAGGLEVRGEVALGDVPRFDVSGRVQTLTPSALVRGELPVEGAVSGTFALRGTPQDAFFDVDLAQTAGQFALTGRVRQRDGQPVFEVAGQVSDFRLGALIGRAGLFPSPLSGALELRGGGGEPYRFDVNLRGDSVVLDLEGTYAAGAVPRYDVEGRVLGLNLAQLPSTLPLPRTNLNARVDVQGQGTTLETLAGTFVIRAEGSTISGVPLDAALLRATAREGILYVDTLALVLRDSRLSAEGALGLTRPAPGVLRYALVAPRLETLARVVAGRGLPPELAGELRAQGWIAGSIRTPTIATALRGRGLRYNAWRAAELDLAAEVGRTALGTWRGEGRLAADNVVLATGGTLEAVRLEATGNEQRLALGLFARRDRGSDIALSGLAEFEDRALRGVLLDSLALRLDGMAWMLANDSRIRWGGVEGILIQDLVLQQTDGGDGAIQIDGQLPPTGTADLEIRVRELNLAAIQALVPSTPPVRGVLWLDAVLEGPVGDPELTVDGAIRALSYQGARADSVSLAAHYDDRLLSATARAWSANTQLLASEARVPMVLSIEDLVPAFELLRDQPVYAQAAADSLSLALLTAAVPQLTEGAGVFAARASLGGTLDRPVLAGWAMLDNGAVRVLPLGVRYHGITGRVSLEEQRVRVDSLAVHSPDGLATLSGTVQFQEDGGPTLYLVSNLRSFLAMDVEETARVQVSGQLALSGDLPNPVLTGGVTLTESTFQIPELDEQSTIELTDVEIGQIGADTVTAGGVLPPFLAGIRAEDLRITMGESVWLVSDDARIQIAGDLRVYRTGDDFRVFGTVLAERGTYTLRVGPLRREFEIARGRVQFQGTGDLNPELDITATNRIRTLQAGAPAPVTVVVNITGTVQYPRIQLTSDTRPPLPESEILSLLLFGRPSFELGGAAGALAEEVLVQEALGGIVFAPLEQIFLSTGLIDYVQFRSVGNRLTQVGQSIGLTTVEVGTELSDDVFWTVECGIGVLFASGAPSCGTRVSLDLGRQLTASAAYEPVLRDRVFQFLSSDLLRYQWQLELRRRWEFGITDAPSVLDSPQTPVTPEDAARTASRPPKK